MLTASAGYGKTTLLDEALGQGTKTVAWISCTDTEREAGRFLMRTLGAIAHAVPGASDVLAERLAAAPEKIDALAATRELLVELPRLLVEPLTLVIDDAERLDGADESLQLLTELIRAEVSALHVAVASRTPLGIRVAKPRAAGRLSTFSASDLAFDAQECAAMLRSRRESDPPAEEVEELMRATEGWPLGIALAIAFVDRAGPSAVGRAPLRNLQSAPDLYSFLSEELLDSLDPELRGAAIESSVARVVTPAVIHALGLPRDFGPRIERAGMLVRPAGEADGFAYHPLLRELLLSRLAVERTEEERRRLHGAVGGAVAEDGNPVEAVEHWLEARSWPEAVVAIEHEGPALTSTSPETVRRWLSLLPGDARALPTIRLLEGQLEWGAGEHPRAVAALRDAIRGFGDRPNPPAEWMARFVLADSLFGIGEFGQSVEIAEGWDDPAASTAGVLAPATATYVAVNLAAIGRFEESDRLAAAVSRHPESAATLPIEAIRRAYHDAPPGRLDQVHAGLQAAAQQLQRSDPFNRRPYLIAALAIVLADSGRPAAALEMWAEVREGASGGAGPFLVDTTHAWSALLHAQEGRLREAEVELGPYAGQEKGWRAHIGHLAAACVASLRGDEAKTVAEAEGAMALVARGPILFRYWTAADLVPALAAVGRPDRARETLAEALALIDESFPGPLGIFPRGRLLALRAWLEHVEGDLGSSDRDLRRFWDEAGETLGPTLRREWERLEAVVWDALVRGVLDPEPAVAGIAHAFPEGLQLVPLLDHPVPEVRRAALAPAAQSGDPAALARLVRLREDTADLSRAASLAVAHLARSLPPLRFNVLGIMSVRRGSWRADDAWARPVDERLVRLLLTHLGQPVPEDVIFEALWPGLSTSSARSSLQVAVSRARHVLDPPGAEISAIESHRRTYRLALGDRDVVDAEEFRSAAERALEARGGERRHALEYARSLWGEEPLPEERYSLWAMGYRERLVDAYTAVLAALAQVHDEAGDHAGTAEVARELVELDPLNEGGHRMLITAYARAGRTGHALRQYLECRRALVEQLGVEPAEATSLLQARILAGEAV